MSDPRDASLRAVVAAAQRLALAMRGQDAHGDAGDAALARVYENDFPFAAEQLFVAIDVAFPGFLEGKTLPLPPIDGERCWVCGCTDDHACEGGCSWIGPDLCSACSATATTILAGGQTRWTAPEAS